MGQDSNLSDIEEKAPAVECQPQDTQSQESPEADKAMTQLKQLTQSNDDAVYLPRSHTQ